MKNIGLFSYMRQAGKVKLHEQGQLSNGRYDELKSAQKMIKNYLKDADCKVDIYDAQTVPADKFVYTQKKDSVFIEVTDLLHNKVESEEFCDKPDEPFLRQIFKFIDKIYGVDEEPIERMKSIQRSKYCKHFYGQPPIMTKITL